MLGWNACRNHETPIARMSPACRHSLPKAGFTLIEMSIVLAIIATLTAGAVSMGSSMIGSAQLASTRGKLDVIENALMAYRVTYNRLPCPADPTLTDVAANSTTYGYDAGYVTANTAGTCAGGSPATSISYVAHGVTVAEGAVPVRTLGLPDEYQFDGWGRKFAYAVAVPLTSKATSTTAYAAFVSYGAQANCGAITVENAAHTNRTQVADYVLLSYGPDGHGGYLKGGTRMNAGVSNADELTNCHCTNTAAAGTYTATYVQKDISLDSASDTVNPFSHLVRFKERWQMQNTYDTYHPGSYFPCSTGFIVNSPVANDNAGYSVAVGDINGDGIPDLIIGAPNQGALTTPGTVYVVFGTRKGFPDPITLNAAFLNGNNGFTINGVTNGDEAGFSVATGDVNGDSISDIIIGAPGRTSGAGAVYVVLGGTGPTNGSWSATPYSLANGGGSTLINGTNGFELDGVAGDSAGWSVVAGDVNKDGKTDIIIGAKAASYTASHSGSVYVVLGGASGTTPKMKDGTAWSSTTNALTSGIKPIDGTNGVRFDGTTAGDNAGYSVASGDVNGDGYADIIIGAPSRTTSTGTVYVMFGQSGAWSGATMPLASASAIIPGASTNDQDGWSVAAGDVNGDGFADIIIGAPGYNSGGNTGRVYVVFGSGSLGNTVPITTYANGTTGFAISGVTAGDKAGYSVAAGDVNIDGYADIIIGAPYRSTGGIGGAVYGVFGSSTTPWTNPTLLSGVNGTSIVEFDGPASSNAGWFLATGDINGDGITDIAIGANGTSSNAGSVYIYNGRSYSWPTTAYSLSGL